MTLLVTVAGCSDGNGRATTTSLVKSTADSTPVRTSGAMPHLSTYTAAMVDNKKDPSCGMPVTAGIGDTVHYSGKVIGFCSKECKDAFMKDPVTAFKKTEFKK